MTPILTDLTTIRTLCDKYGFSLSKGFGQNFIVNAGICPKICETAGIDKATNVLEIGPGFGTLTQQLAQRAKKVVCVEIDTRLLPVLEETLADFSNVTVINQDILQCDLQSLLKQEFGDEPVTVCANLPYYITSPIVMMLLESNLPIENITAMVQKEAAERICAKPGTRECGAISYAVSYYSQPSIEFSVKAGSFYPPPKVTGAIIQLKVNPAPALASQPKKQAKLFALIRASFSQRRKTLVNGASAGLSLPKSGLQAAMEKAGLAQNLRPEQLTLADFLHLQETLWPQEDA